MRDFADCVNCFKLPEFSKNELLKGFSKEMKKAALEKFKLHDVMFFYINCIRKCFFF